ncbi:MAG: PIN domain-containing protein [Nitrospiraceae bacterium]|nr:PIN domain-containing protein [Nitrospiraceae bacterium]
MKVSELPDRENIFVDANIYLFNALDDPRCGEASTRFLEKIERGEINAVTNVLVLNEVAFKILMAELSNYSEKFNIWIAKKLLKSKEIAENAYKPVKQYLAYLEGLECLEITEITPRIAFSSVVLGQRYGLLPSDSFHLATMKEFGMTFIVTDDADFKGVDLAEVVELGVL